jgi:hypothetical protein
MRSVPIALAPTTIALRTDLAAALVAERRGPDALDMLRTTLAAQADWIDGHRSFARLSAMLGCADAATETIDAALAKRPDDIALHMARLAVLARLTSPAQRLETATVLRRRLGDHPPLLIEEAIAASEAGRIADADRLFMGLGRHQDASLALAILRHLIRAQRFDQADQLAARLVDSPESVTAWAYRHTAWRATGDPRLDWLEQGGALVRSFDLAADLPLDRLRAVLEEVHGAAGQPLDQSVRGGSQSDGPLFARIEPEIQAVRAAAEAAIGRYRAALPAPDFGHPLLSAATQGRPRFAGAWSVRLTGGGGHHTNHIHGLGWLSSALYVALPPMAGQDGWLTIGAPPAELALDMPPRSTVEPKPGRLVLFPSWLWHGVTPFGDGERLTIAFDVARPCA